MRRFTITFLVLFFLVFPSACLQAAPTEKRVALVIGNGKYASAPLTNPANDAEDMAAVLKKLGFEVILKRDAGKKAMDQAVKEFYRKLQEGKGLGLFYYAGHGIQVRGQNYLVPVDAEIESEGDVDYSAIEAGWVLRKMEDAGNPVNIVVLDACRNNPFTRSFRSAERGLAQMPSPTGSIIAYATGPGDVAADGQGRNGLFTKHLLRHLPAPGLSVDEVFNQVRQGVWSESGKKQTPWTSSSLMGRVAIATGAVKIETMPAEPSGRPSVGDGSNAKWAPSPATVASASAERIKNGLGMEFVWIEPGSFEMGSPMGQEYRLPDETQHQVTLTRGYYLQTTEVTQGQWKAVMGSNPSMFNSCGDQCPVEQVSWEDVQEYIRKLEAGGEGTYRLPTEAEWEYACRAGGKGMFSFADDLKRLGVFDQVEEFSWNHSNSGGKTHPVASKRANAWGLYDMHGNVWEWCSDWYGDYPSAPVTDPAGPGGGSYRVDRGGVFDIGPSGVRSAFRGRGAPDVRDGGLGFRLARTE